MFLMLLQKFSTKCNEMRKRDGLEREKKRKKRSYITWCGCLFVVVAVVVFVVVSNLRVGDAL